MKGYTVKIQFDSKDAAKAQDWLANRGGIAVWTNCNLSSHSIGSQSYTPAMTDGKPTGSPGWQFGNSGPSRIVTDPAEVLIVDYTVHSRVRVIPGKYGPPCDPIKRGRDKVDAALEAAGAGSYWQFDYMSRNYGSAWVDCVIYKRTSETPLSQWNS